MTTVEPSAAVKEMVPDETVVENGDSNSNHNSDGGKHDHSSNPENATAQEQEDLEYGHKKPATPTPTTNRTSMADAPFHVLMLPSATSPPRKPSPRPPAMEPQFVFADQRLRRDYLSRRHRVFYASESAPEFCTTNVSNTKRQKQSMQQGQHVAVADDHRMALWSGASWLERALVGCCELPPKPTTPAASSVKKTSPKKEHPSSSDNTNTKSEDLGWKGGSLVPGFEVRFVGLVVRYCHTPASRILAMAILERTLEQDQAEAELQVLLDTASIKDNQTPEHDQTKKQSTTGEDKEQEQEDCDDEDEEAEEQPEDGNELNASGKRRRSMRLRVTTRSPPAKREKTKKHSNSSQQNNKAQPPINYTSPMQNMTMPNDSAKEDNEEAPSSDRFTTFLAAGGLRILNSWLVDAMTPVVVPSTNPATPIHNHQTRTRKALASSAAFKQIRPSKYGPMLLPLLELLTSIPFDKDLVMQSRINKQIRRLSKQVDALIETHEKQQQHQQHMTTDGDNSDSSNDNTQTLSLEALTDPSTGGLSVVQVQKALNALKSKWEEHVKNSPTSGHRNNSCPRLVNPFGAFQRKLKERLASLQQFEERTAEKPTWLQISDDHQASLEKKRQQQRHQQQRQNINNRVAPPKFSTEQLAAKEREAEREALRDRLKAAEKERKKQMQRLQNQLKKRKISPTAATAAAAASSSEGEAPSTWKQRKIKKKHQHSVKWRDGLNTDKIKKRELLEQVFDPPAVLQEDEKQEEEKMETKIAAASAQKRISPREAIKCEEIEFCEVDDYVL